MESTIKPPVMIGQEVMRAAAEDQNHVKPKEADNGGGVDNFGSRKLSMGGGAVSNLRDRFNNNNSVKPDVTARPVRPGVPGKPSVERPSIPGRPGIKAVPPQRAVPSLPKRVTKTDNVPIPSLPTRVQSPAVEPESPSAPTITSNSATKRWPPVQVNNNTNKVDPPGHHPAPVNKPVPNKPVPKPIEPIRKPVPSGKYNTIE